MIKDSEENFIYKPKCKLLKPTKIYIGIIRKTIMKGAFMFTKKALSINQRRNTSEAIKWFNNIKRERGMHVIAVRYLRFSTNPSQKINCYIAYKEVKIIKPAQKPILFHDGCLWINSNDPDI